MIWISPRERLPQQGLKVLCFDDGDFWVAQRFGQYWFPIPFCDSQYASSKAPTLWKHIEFPGPYNGLMIVSVDGETMNMDEFEGRYPIKFSELVDTLKKSVGERK